MYHHEQGETQLEFGISSIRVLANEGIEKSNEGLGERTILRRFNHLEEGGEDGGHYCHVAHEYEHEWRGVDDHADEDVKQLRYVSDHEEVTEKPKPRCKSHTNHIVIQHCFLRWVQDLLSCHIANVVETENVEYRRESIYHCPVINR